MSNGKDMLQEAVKELYKQGWRANDIQVMLKPILEKSEKTCEARDTIVEAIFSYLNAVHPDMTNTYTTEDLTKFVVDQIFGTIDKDLEELRSLKNDGYKKAATIDLNNCEKAAIWNADEQTLREFLRTL